MIQRDIDRPTEEQIENLREINPNDLGHHVDFGHSSPELEYMGTASSARLVGPVVTVRIPPEDGTMVHKAIELLRPGDVLVIDMQGHRTNAPWGDVTTHAAIEQDAAGVVIDGSVTDTKGITQLDFPVFARGHSTRTVSVEGRGGDINVTVQAGGAPVAPGDVAIGNEDGVLFVPRDEIGHALDLCAGKPEREEDVIQQLREGKSLADISGADELLSEDERSE
jgi:regulator of RNase E activity RraA